MVDNGEVGGVVEERIDSEVAPQSVLLRSAKKIIANNEAIVHRHRAALLRIFGGRGNGRTERRRFDDFVFKENMGETEATANDAAVAKDTADLFGGRIGGNIKVFGLTAEQKIANGTPR